MYKRTHELESMIHEYENRLDSKLFPSMNDQHVVVVTYELSCPVPDGFRDIDQSFLDAFTNNYARKALAMTWVIKRPFGFHSVQSELRFILPLQTKFLIGEVDISHLYYSGIDHGTVAWASAKS